MLFDAVPPVIPDGMRWLNTKTGETLIWCERENRFIAITDYYISHRKELDNLPEWAKCCEKA